MADTGRLGLRWPLTWWLTQMNNNNSDALEPMNDGERQRYSSNDGSGKRWQLQGQEEAQKREEMTVTLRVLRKGKRKTVARVERRQTSIFSDNGAPAAK